MSATDSSPAFQGVASQTTVSCYDFWDCVFRRAGILDYTEGFYQGDATLSYEQAQQNQICHLLDRVGCRSGSRILEIGCGNGTLLDEVRRRGGTGVGVTISPQQVHYCRERGHEVHLLNYRDIGEDWRRRFDAVVANGSMEHFVQPVDALQGHADAIYARFFEIAHRCLDPHSYSHKLINTTIHFDRVQIGPQDVIRNPWSFPWFSDKFHCALLVRGFGGFYPVRGQFERCAHPWFKLIDERDATHDCYLTSEEWLRRGKRSLLTPGQWARLLPFVIRHPRYAPTMLFLLLVSQSWNWQFRARRTGGPPMTHLWQTWDYQEP